MKTLKLRKHHSIKQLAANPTTTNLADYDFRSPEEVMEFLRLLEENLNKSAIELDAFRKRFNSVTAAEDDGSVKISINRKSGGKSSVFDFSTDTVEKINIQNMTRLKDQFGLSVRLAEQNSVLDTLINNISQAFRGEKGVSVLKAAQLTKSKVQKKQRDVLKFLGELAKKHEPKRFDTIINSTMSFFYDSFKNMYGDIQQLVYVVPRSENTPATTPGAPGQPDTKVKPQYSLVFNHYIAFKDLKNKFHGFTFPTYYIVFSAVVDSQGGMSMYCNTLHTFRSPGTFKLGRQFKNTKDAVRLLETLFKADDLVDMLEKQTIHVEPEKLTPDKFRDAGFIKSTSIEGHEIRIGLSMAPKDSMTRSVADSIFEDLAAILNVEKGQLKYNITPGNKGGSLLRIILVKVPGSLTFSEHEAEDLKTRYGFDQVDIKNLRELIQRG